MLIEYKNHKIFAFSDTHGLNDRLEILIGTLIWMPK